MKKLNVGDVLQYDENGYRHTIIISLVYDYNGAHYVKYCGHTDSKRNVEVKYFKRRLEEIEAKYFYVTSYK